MKSTNNNYGTKETAEILQFLGAFATTTGDVAADGKVSLLELLKYVNLWPVIAPAVEGAPTALLELGDLDTAERNELKQVFGDALKLDKPVTEELLEEGADLGLHIVQFIFKVKELRAQKAA